jgi:hypothetical protein
MRARTAYISSLGITGLSIASSLSLLLVVGAIVAFDGWPTLRAETPTDMAIGLIRAPGAEPAVVRVGVRAARSDRPAAARRRVLRRRRPPARRTPARVEVLGTGSEVVSDLPAPVAVPSARTGKPPPVPIQPVHTTSSAPLVAPDAGVTAPPVAPAAVPPAVGDAVAGVGGTLPAAAR